MVQAYDVKRTSFLDTPERLSPGSAAFPAGDPCEFWHSQEELYLEDLREAEELYRTIAVEYLSLEDPTNEEVRSFIFHDIKPHVTKTTALDIICHR